MVVSISIAIFWKRLSTSKPAFPTYPTYPTYPRLEQMLEHVLLLLGIISVAGTRPLPANVRDDVARREWEKGQALRAQRLKLRKEERLARQQQRKNERQENRRARQQEQHDHE